MYMNKLGFNSSHHTSKWHLETSAPLWERDRSICFNMIKRFIFFFHVSIPQMVTKKNESDFYLAVKRLMKFSSTNSRWTSFRYSPCTSLWLFRLDFDLWARGRATLFLLPVHTQSLAQPTSNLAQSHEVLKCVGLFRCPKAISYVASWLCTLSGNSTLRNFAAKT